MGQPRIVLAGVCPTLAGLTWHTDRVLRIGRQSHLEVVLRDFSIDRIHAEVGLSGGRWILRHLSRNPLYLTLVNGEPVRAADRPLLPQDVIQLGKLTLRVAELDTAHGATPAAISRNGPPEGDHFIRASGLHVRVQATANRTWHEALEAAITQRGADTPVPRNGLAGLVQQNRELTQGMMTLLRANQHLTRLSDLDELLQCILADTVAALGAQRGTILLIDPATGELTPCATLGTGLTTSRSGRAYSRTLIDRCFRLGESILCRDARSDEDLAHAQSVRAGAMTSIICAVLRSPRNRLGVLHLDRGPLQENFTENDLYLADALAANVAVGIESAQLVEQQRQQFIDTVHTLARAVEMRDPYTANHTGRVTEYSLLVADALQLPATERYQLQLGTPLHDIGKIGIDDAILRKPGRLTAAEFEAMKTHTTKGASMLTALVNLAPMIPIVKHHHERFDGTGYPDRLSGEQIPLSARIVAVADAFDAMTSDRPYRRALPADKAFLELLNTAGTHFDPRCVHAFLKARPQVESLLLRP